MHTISDTVTRKIIDFVDLQNLEIETDSGWHPISKIMKTIPYQVWTVITESGKRLECADDHIVFDENFNEIFVKNIKPLSYIQTDCGLDRVVSIVVSETEENMFDITVNSNDHRYYTNGILSHNTTLIQGLCYGLYGHAITNIKKDNLINRTNGKGMLVTVDFECSGINYKIERGRKPNILKFYVNDQLQEAKDDNSQGDSRETQQDIERLLNMSYDMFKHIVVLNTYTEPFLGLRALDQRNIIEQLLGITLLSEKSEILKEQNRETKDAITQEDFRIKSVKDSNARISEQIDALIRRQNLWRKKNTQDISDLSLALDELNKLDIENELKAHKDLAVYKQKSKDISDLTELIRRSKLDMSREQKDIKKLELEIQSLENHTCHSCGQAFHDEKQEQVLLGKQKSLADAKLQNSKTTNDLAKLEDALKSMGELTKKPQVYYDNESDAFEHKSSIANVVAQLKAKKEEIDPYADQISEMKEYALQEISYDHINNLTTFKEHQEFLLKLLTNKDSFIRKKIIDQNLSYLNARLGYYLDKIGLPHTVKFLNDLTVSIEEYGRELDYGNLSRGETTRLVLSLSWAFRDVWESLYQPINLLFIDELVDNGLDSNGTENTLAILKKMSRDTNKSIWLVSHKDDLVSRVSNILRVVKSNGFTSYSADVEMAN